MSSRNLVPLPARRRARSNSVPAAVTIRDVGPALHGSLDGKPVAHDGAGNAIGDPRRVVQELHHHMPRIVENQQRLGPIVGQLACDHYGLEPQMNVFF